MALSQPIQNGHGLFAFLFVVEQLIVSWRVEIRLYISCTFLFTDFFIYFLLEEVFIVFLNMNIVRVVSRLRMRSFELSRFELVIFGTRPLKALIYTYISRSANFYIANLGHHWVKP